MEIDLNSVREKIISTATTVFEKIINLPGRTDDKKRTGVQLLVLEPGTRNLINISIGNPSETAKFLAVEKAVRSNLLGDVTSQNSEGPLRMRFAGSLTIYNDLQLIQASTSGLKAEEDVVVSLLILAEILQKKPVELRKNIETKGGKMPECFNDKNHYLYSLVN